MSFMVIKAMQSLNWSLCPCQIGCSNGSPVQCSYPGFWSHFAHARASACSVWVDCVTKSSGRHRRTDSGSGLARLAISGVTCLARGCCTSGSWRRPDVRTTMTAGSSPTASGSADRASCISGPSPQRKSLIKKRF